MRNQILLYLPSSLVVQPFHSEWAHDPWAHASLNPAGQIQHGLQNPREQAGQIPGCLAHLALKNQKVHPHVRQACWMLPLSTELRQGQTCFRATVRGEERSARSGETCGCCWPMAGCLQRVKMRKKPGPGQAPRQASSYTEGGQPRGRGCCPLPVTQPAVTRPHK